MKIFIRSKWRFIYRWQSFNWTGKRVLFKRVYFGPIEIRKFDTGSV